MNLKKTGWIVLGLVGLSLGAAGAVLPMLPCVPFLLLAAVGFSKGSRKLHEWFVHTKLYKENLEDYGMCGISGNLDPASCIFLLFCKDNLKSEKDCAFCPIVVYLRKY